MPDNQFPLTDAITVEDFYKKLSFGPLSNLSMANEGDGTILTGSKGKMVNYINDGLLDLYTRLNIWEKEVLIKLMGGYTNYRLLARHSESYKIANPDSEYDIFIIDALLPFEQDVVKVLSVYNQDGRILPLNDTERGDSVYTPYNNVVQVLRPIQGYHLSIMYQAKHRKIEYGVDSSLIYLPEALWDALVNYIAGKVFSSMNGAENTAKGAEYTQKYENSVARAIVDNLVGTSPSTSNTKFEKRGFK